MYIHYPYLERFNLFLRWVQYFDSRATVVVIITTARKATPSTQMMVVLSVSRGFGLKLVQSSSVSDFNSAMQIGSTLNTVPFTVRDGPLLTHIEKKTIKSSAE